MNYEDFKKNSEKYGIVPVYEKITGDFLTPVSAFIKLRKAGNYAFLLESIEGIGRFARYSFIGKDPKKIVQNSGNQIQINENGAVSTQKNSIFQYLKDEIKSHKSPEITELPDFTGGIVGYLGFENVSLIEDVIQFSGKDDLDTPDSIFGFFDTIIAFDHYKHQLIIISNVHKDDFNNLEDGYNHAKNEIASIIKTLAKPLKYDSFFKLTDNDFESFNPHEFYKTVDKGKENIYNGDVFQLVLSKRFSSSFNGDPFNVYRALRMINPSPYMYFMEFGTQLTVLGTSPEDLIKVKKDQATILPIAGTRPRGDSEKEDLELEADLKKDPKEVAEHQMLVDLARNDLGRVCEYNSIKLSEKMNVHRFSHVMHIVSRVEGKLLKDKDCIDALMASFPAGTVSGAPKIRAIQLIDEYENLRRNVYAGAVGYIDFSGNLDMCIAIRTLFAKDNRIFWQAGAGIVADSNSENELNEIRNKSAALLEALKYAEVIDENINYR